MSQSELPPEEVTLWEVKFLEKIISQSGEETLWKVNFLEKTIPQSEEDRIWKEWKEKSRVDYPPIFVALWFSFNAWIKKEYNSKNKPIAKDRDYINSLKKDGSSPLISIFAELINPDNPDESSSKFRSDFAELIKSLINANIRYDKNPEKMISFENCVIEWDTKLGGAESQKYVSVMKKERQQQKIKIGNELWIENDMQYVFAAYIEILYQIRCAFFHGTLSPIEKNERVIRHLYLTLSVLMEKAK